MSIIMHKAGLAAGGVAFALGLALASGAAQAEQFGFGSPASAAEIAALDIDVMPDGRGAPPGSGDHAAGKQVYAESCVACHGEDLGGVKGTGGAALIGGRGSLTSGKPKKTVESYWPYAATVFDYVKRAMPFDAPGSLSDDQVYAVVAYILAEGNVIDKSAVMNAQTLAEVEMPNKDGFIFFPGGGGHRPDVHNYR